MFTCSEQGGNLNVSNSLITMKTSSADETHETRLIASEQINGCCGKIMQSIVYISLMTTIQSSLTRNKAKERK